MVQDRVRGRLFDGAGCCDGAEPQSVAGKGHMIEPPTTVGRERRLARAAARMARPGGAPIATPMPDPELPPDRRSMSDTERAAAAQADRTGLAPLRSILRIRPFRRLWLV